MTKEAESGAADAITKDYSLNWLNNREKMTVTGAKSYTVRYSYDLNNRLLTEIKNEGTTAETTDYFYDNNGNTVSKNTSVVSSSDGAEDISLTLGNVDGAELYNYDGFNQLVKVDNKSGISTYAYRPDGLRMSKTVNGVTTNHVWDGQDISLELDASGNVIDRYTRGIGLIKSDKNGFYLYNAHGDVVQLTNNTGAVTKAYDYDAFGVEKNPTDTDINPFRYCGEYFDKETGSVYLRARYYDAEIGRSMTEDSAKDGLNWYTYCNNSPIMFVDPNGLDARVITTNTWSVYANAHTSVIVQDGRDGNWYYFYWGDKNLIFEKVPYDKLDSLRDFNDWIKEKGAGTEKGDFKNSSVDYNTSTYIEGDFSASVDYFRELKVNNPIKISNRYTRVAGTNETIYLGINYSNEGYRIFTRNCMQVSFNGLKSGKLPDGTSFENFVGFDYFGSIRPNDFRSLIRETFFNTKFTKNEAREEIGDVASKAKKWLTSNNYFKQGQKYAEMLGVK